MIKRTTKPKTKTSKRKRDYKKEYRDFHGTPKQIKLRDSRNAARRAMEKAGRVRKGDGREVDHKVPLSRGGSNSRRNLRVVSRKVNRRKGAKRR